MVENERTKDARQGPTGSCFMNGSRATDGASRIASLFSSYDITATERGGGGAEKDEEEASGRVVTINVEYREHA
jgi:hypothetical protein